MPTITLTLPVPGDVLLAPHVDNYTALQNLLNGGLDGANIRQDIAIALGAPGVTLGGDVNLYRSGADFLATDDQFFSMRNNTAQIRLGSNSGIPTIWFGNQSGDTGDVSVYRWTPGNLRTNSSLWANGSLVAGASAAGGRLYLSDSLDQLDTSLYRGGIGIVKTDNELHAVGDLYAGWTGFDYTLHTDNAGIVNVNGNLVVDGTIQPYFGGLSAYKSLEYGPADSGGSGYRVIRIPN